MREFEELLVARQRELEKHLSFVQEMYKAVLDRKSPAVVDIEHVNILMSAFLVHLYNVIESVMAKTIEEIASNTKEHHPHEWTDGIFLSWIRYRAALGEELGPEDRLDRVVKVISEAAGRNVLGSTYIAKREGNWSHKEIKAIADSLGCELAFEGDIYHHACERHFLDKKTPIHYVRHMRNQLGHGNVSFVDAASSLSAAQLESLMNIVISYMTQIVKSFAAFLDVRRFLRENAA